MSPNVRPTNATGTRIWTSELAIRASGGSPSAALWQLPGAAARPPVLRRGLAVVREEQLVEEADEAGREEALAQDVVEDVDREAEARGEEREQRRAAGLEVRLLDERLLAPEQRAPVLHALLPLKVRLEAAEVVGALQVHVPDEVPAAAALEPAQVPAVLRLDHLHEILLAADADANRSVQLVAVVVVARHRVPSPARRGLQALRHLHVEDLHRARHRELHERHETGHDVDAKVVLDAQDREVVDDRLAVDHLAVELLDRRLVREQHTRARAQEAGAQQLALRVARRAHEERVAEALQHAHGHGRARGGPREEHDSVVVFTAGRVAREPQHASERLHSHVVEVRDDDNMVRQRGAGDRELGAARVVDHNVLGASIGTHADTDAVEIRMRRIVRPRRQSCCCC
ncbi:hypothetical protein PybrP1_009857 [[Pythium] brassicae (nom. inval.)]|nr:hypothetical protein PybrP1_009857 [[Pythium] brassicae (nom. inval.)]